MKTPFFSSVVGTGTCLVVLVHVKVRIRVPEIMLTTLLGSCCREENWTLPSICLTVAQYLLHKKIIPLAITGGRRSVSILYCTLYLEQHCCYMGTTFAKPEYRFALMVPNSYKDGVYPVMHVQWAASISLHDFEG